jgi:chitinase
LPTGQDVDIIILAFLLRFNGAGNSPVMNFANQGDKCTLFPGTETFNCPEIAADIVVSILLPPSTR